MSTSLESAGTRHILRPLPTAAWWTLGLALVTTAQLVFATTHPTMSQYAEKAFWFRAIMYPLLTLGPILIWWVVSQRRGITTPLPWAGFLCIATMFFFDMTGNTLNLYDVVWWWDDANHLFLPVLACSGVGIWLRRTSLQQRWAMVLVIAGIGALLTLAWEFWEYSAFIRVGNEYAMAYTDTLSDEALSTLGAFLGAFVVTRNMRTDT